jgi:alpha-glucosidase
MAVATQRLQEVTAQQLQVAYRFVKVEDYFSNYRSWNTLGRVIAYEFDSSRTLALTFQRNDEKNCVMLIQFLQKDIMRIRFNPSKGAPNDYASHNTRSIVLDTVDDLLAELEASTVEFRGEPQNQPKRTLQAQEKQTLYLTTKGPDQQPFMEVIVQCNPFRLTVLRSSGDRTFQVWTTALPGLYYTPNGHEDYAIVQAVEKPATAKYIGFGEHGGKHLSKNTAQVAYFNFDNMRYKQVYNHGPFEEREPLYHSEPFFMEFNGVPNQESVYGIFVDNYSQVCVDVGYCNSSRYMFGTRFGDLNYYFLLGQTCVDVMNDFTDIVGKAKLKPRYVLGYHQGCYGYEKRQDLEEVVKTYREYGIPLDGLHIDVDIQHNYQTFTIDERKFPNPQEMFARLREQGVKCSTNITPIISNKDPNYTTYQEGLANGYFVLDKRCDPDNPDGRRYQDYGGGSEYYYEFTDPEQNFNSGNPYIGEVYYGGDRGTTGHYPDLGRKPVRVWWGTQYQYLFDMGLEMVWQDMTTPAIRSTRGDMRGFPFRLLVTDDSLSDVTPELAPAIKVWNIYSYNLHKATYHGLNHLAGRENKRNFIIGRGCFSGVNKFAGLWTGDNASSWQFLNMNVFQVLALGLCGVAICGQDIGGFEPEEDWHHWADPELLIRWTCAGAFLPWFRNHYIKKDGKKYFQEPYAYQFVDLDAWNVPQEKRYLYGCVLPICKYYIELRYRLLQLFYDAMFENTLDGMPICRAMFLNDPADKALYNDKLSFLNNQFFIRKDLLIAPILDPQSDSNAHGKCDVYLPAGSDWYAFMDNKRPLMSAVEGGTTVQDYDAHIDDSPDHIGFIVPIYVRAGAIIPTIELEQYIGQRNALNQPNPITLNIYPVNIPPEQAGQPTSKRYEYIMYLDDGVSRSSAPLDAPQYRDSEEEREWANSEYRETHITHTYLDRKTREMKVERTHDKYTPKFETYFFVAVLHDPAEPKGSTGPLKSISIQRDGDRQKVDPMTVGTPEQRADNLKASITDAWYYNEHLNISFIKVIDNNKLITITADYV